MNNLFTLFVFIMKNFLLITLAAVTTIALSACSQAPVGKTDQAEKYGLETKEYQELKEAAARMGMTLNNHMKMIEE
jgi:hypothetical protein